MKRFTVLLLSLAACSDAEPTAKDAGKASGAAATDAKTPNDAAKAEPAKTDAPVAEPAKPETEPAKPDAAAVEAPETPPAAPGEIAIAPWASAPHTTTWRLVAEPSEPLTFVTDLNAGVLGRAGTTWYQRGEDGQLAVVTMDVDPKPPVLGVWPDDAWFVDTRERTEDDVTYTELRLMKLRGGDRWVPQDYAFGLEQWYRPETDDEHLPHISTRSGMLVYSDKFGDIPRIAGKHPDPELGANRGDVVDFVEAGSGKVYILSRDEAGFYAQIHCENLDEACVTANAMKLPLADWKFDRKVARGRHAVSVLASSGERAFILHYGGKSDGWLLEELPAGERPNGMWASDEGGLWTLAGEHLRWRDTGSVWHDVALPEGMTAPSVALTSDRKEVWVAGQVGGAAKVFAASANAAAAPAAPAP